MGGRHFPDDGVSPLAVVISAEVGGGAMNFIDAHIALDASRALARALDPEATLPDDEDGDNDGLLDPHETGTGVALSRTDTGTDPTLPDTDGDFFWDGTEINTGSDPTDPASVPDRVAIRVGTLTLWGVLLLPVALAGCFFALRQGSRASG